MTITVDYGNDLSCTFDLSATLGTVTGRLLLCEALVRRLTTARGTLLDDPNFGIDIRDWINEGMTLSELKQRAAQIDAELLKDERVIASKTKASYVQGVLTLIVAITDAGGPFSLNLAVSDTTVDILSVN